MDMALKKKYKQAVIPYVDDAKYVPLKTGDIKRLMVEYFTENLAGKSVVNIHKGITIVLSKSGLRHVVHARRLGFYKLLGIKVLDQMLIHAKYTNFSEPDADDSEGILGYMNFTATAKIGTSLHTFRLVVRMTTAGKFYYDHATKLRQ